MTLFTLLFSSVLPIVHHAGNHAITTIAMRSASARGTAVQKNSNSLASGIRRIDSMMISESPIQRANAIGKISP
ncbi:MAG: hypothetical protein WAW59_04995 [Patescibacteria group bacterium]